MFKQLLYLLRVGVGGNVPVLWFSAQKPVTHATANEVGLMSSLVEAHRHGQHPRRDTWEYEGRT
jgi:hypothetical protein